MCVLDHMCCTHSRFERCVLTLALEENEKARRVNATAGLRSISVWFSHSFPLLSVGCGFTMFIYLLIKLRFQNAIYR